MILTRKTIFPWLTSLSVLVKFLYPLSAEEPGHFLELKPVLVESNGVYGVEFRAGREVIGSSSPTAPAGIELRLPGEASQPLQFRKKSERRGRLELGPARQGALTLRLRIEQLNPSLIRRTLEVTATKPQRFAATFSFSPAIEGQYSVVYEDRTWPRAL